MATDDLSYYQAPDTLTPLADALIRSLAKRITVGDAKRIRRAMLSAYEDGHKSGFEGGMDVAMVDANPGKYTLAEARRAREENPYI